MAFGYNVAFSFTVGSTELELVASGIPRGESGADIGGSPCQGVIMDF